MMISKSYHVHELFCFRKSMLLSSFVCCLSIVRKRHNTSGINTQIHICFKLQQWFKFRTCKNSTKKKSSFAHCEKAQKYEQGEIDLLFLIFGANEDVEHYGKRIKSCMGVLLRADLTSHPFRQMGLIGHALLGQPSKGHLCRILILFP